MLRTLACIVMTAALALACGSDKGADFGASGTGGIKGAPAGGGVQGTAGASGATSAGGAAQPSGGATNSGSGGEGSVVCPAPGARLPSSGACYAGCTYEPGSPPRYESANGPCTSIGWKCSALQYCNPNVHCIEDASCQRLAGPGWSCVPTPDGPLVGQCAIQCTTDADCPDSKGTTPSPYTCKTVDNGTAVVHICRF
ncbi:MAG TPA: hypothetical protein VF395_07150 [Polyangiaceae bacterium]